MPRTEITIARVADGDRAGEYLFSPDTVDRAPQFYEKFRNLPHQTDYLPGNYEHYVDRPGIRLPHQWVDALPSWARARFLRNSVWKWIALGLSLAVGALLIGIASRLARNLDQWLDKRDRQWRVGRLLFSFTIVVIPLLISGIVRKRYRLTV